MKFDFYKKYIKDQDARLAVLRLLNLIPDKYMIRLQYRIKLGRKLNLNHPKRYTEKIQWYKLYYHDQLMTKCADKYTVRSYIEEKGLTSTLNTLYWAGFDITALDFSKLPNQFVIKVTTGSGTNIIVKDKSKLDIAETIKTVTKWMKNEQKKSPGREWAYEDSTPRIIVEKYLEDTENGIVDYKFFCFNGEISHVIVISDRFSGEKLDVYSKNWKKMRVIYSTCLNQTSGTLEKPAFFERMKEIAETLSKDFPHVRVDLYEINGKVYFGEMTFYDASGYNIFEPDSFDFWLGKKFKLPNKRGN